jgi:hypothetical protein
MGHEMTVTGKFSASSLRTECCPGTAWFNGATFYGDAWFNRATFTGAVPFGGATFSGWRTRRDRTTRAGTAMPLGPALGFPGPETDPEPDPESG